MSELNTSGWLEALELERQLPDQAAEPQPPNDCDPARRSFLRRAAGVAGVVGVVGAGVLTASKADASEANPGLTARAFRDIRRHENSHVLGLLNVLGANARTKPTFMNLAQPNIRKFLLVSQALENTGVGAYLGALPAVNGKAVISAAGSIALIEARHAGWLNSLVNAHITTNLFGQEQNFERPFTISQVVNSASPFLASLNGGPPLTFSSTPSDSNDIAILNFALALEFLEAEFYNINVPKFY